MLQYPRRANSVSQIAWTEPYYRQLMDDLVSTPPIMTETWQAMNVRGSVAHRMHEMEDVTIVVPYPSLWDGPAFMAPDLPWAEDHFNERVSGVPYNPPPSAARWPHAVRGNADHTTGAEYDHTYPERFWPRRAGTKCPSPEECMSRCEGKGQGHYDHRGIRFAYGDLSDVVALLVRDRGTRQAYLPVWFPEDTGAEHNGKAIRVPCTLGYHFMIRDGELSCRYYLRSCDVYRHLNNDIYMASRLMAWVADAVNHYTALIFDEDYAEHNGKTCPPDVTVGRLIVHVASLHLFVADVHKLKERMS
jgi:hypothetical protein